MSTMPDGNTAALRDEEQRQDRAEARRRHIEGDARDRLYSRLIDGRTWDELWDNHAWIARDALVDALQTIHNHPENEALALALLRQAKDALIEEDVRVETEARCGDVLDDYK